MATYKIRGGSHCIIFPYRLEPNNKATKQQWETYTTELEATQRKVFIEYLQRNKDYDGLLKAVNEYKQRKAIEKMEAIKDKDNNDFEVTEPTTTDNYHRTYRDFALKWLPFHARKKRFSPTTYNAYEESLEAHILPYFGDRIMSTITSRDIDDFLDFMSKKPCRGSKSYNKPIKEIPTLSSSSVKKHYNVFVAGLKTAIKWKYIFDIPVSSAPAEKQKRRKAWDSQMVLTILDGIEDKVLHLAVHLGFVCSMRAGEVGGFDIKTLDFRDRSFWITQELERVKDKAINALPQNEIIQTFPKKLKTSMSRLALLPPKTEGSYRKQYLTTPLLQDIKDRLQDIEECKAIYGKDYKDYGLLLCKPGGRPIDPHSYCKSFKKWQTKMGIAPENQIEFQGLRKSGQMHKVRLSQNNYQLVAEASGQSPEVLMSNYNDVLDGEKRNLSMLVETSFYSSSDAAETHQQSQDTVTILKALESNPELSEQILQLLLNNACDR